MFKQLCGKYIGTCMRVTRDNGFTKEIFLQTFRNTCSYHLWIISSISPLIFIRRVLMLPYSSSQDFFTGLKTTYQRTFQSEGSITLFNLSSGLKSTNIDLSEEISISD